MTVVPTDYFVEILEDAPVSLIDLAQNRYDVFVEFGSVYIPNLIAEQAEIIEVFSLPPVGGGYLRIEVLAFTKQGALSITTNASEFPIAGGIFTLDSVAARVVVPPTGSSVILDILKNGTSVFTNPADRPTIQSGANNASTTLPAGIMFADGDYLEINIVAVGSTTPGDTLTAAVRLARVG